MTVVDAVHDQNDLRFLGFVDSSEEAVFDFYGKTPHEDTARSLPPNQKRRSPEHNGRSINDHTL